MGKGGRVVSHPGLNFPEDAEHFLHGVFCLFVCLFAIELISFVKFLLVECRFYP